MTSDHESKKAADASPPKQASKKHHPDGDPAPVAVAGPESQRREQPQAAGTDDPGAEASEDPAPVAVAGPEARERAKE
ncbi:hypothetical protein ACQW02_02120 [Humitalea sp. 24SJ18S-53]|uniref:hypothetical protein n=1 Tax=Humitalea sp. 24SJ18S-53 TaxID=3422307 RepID=UPI003D66D6AC